MIVCPRCGAQNWDGATSCARCQTPFAVSPIYVATPVYDNAPVPGHGMGVASMVLGILALVLFCLWPVSVVCSVLGLFLGIAGLCRSSFNKVRNGAGVAGLVCSIIALAIALVVAAAFAESWFFINGLY